MVEKTKTDKKKKNEKEMKMENENNTIHLSAEDLKTPNGSLVEEKEKKDNKKIIVLILLILLLLAACAGIFMLNQNQVNNPGYDDNASSLSWTNASDEEVQAELDRRTEESKMWISVAATSKVLKDTNQLSAKNTKNQDIPVVSNLTENTRDIKYTFTLEDGTVLYESGLIKPGESIQTPEVQNKPASGVYDVTVTAQGYNTETHQPQGGPLNAIIKIVVE